ncbi:MAG TPA: polyribonucleotide nucleotidyltransferase [Spirochaetota bacterium]|nr:polyribonucleotide nucleotidyltransferase [Spirochaetota bacterium]HOT20058.1 polyribonucleotide nucleotidyltransferase [Spirochaetota bacterium]HPD05032.1 polyribonucleotide nucleotidyltransferase [Spirochaetota bacterium]HQI38068.1 polyribonucleotide nucleotidyltransferase [Spirochaetota bacterium]HQK06730.1 polyribonucleotide nucleotidyltransferase [Spirochaetota bacterium]
MNKEFAVTIGNDLIQFSTGILAKQADGAVVVSCGETIVFSSAVASKKVVEGQDFFPLTVDYREKHYSAGKIPGGFIKREGRPSDKEILTSRLADRPIRPLFPDDFVNEVQIIIYVLSADREHQPDILAINAASAALSISGVPFKGPVGAVRVGRVDGQWIVNPSFQEMENSDIDLVVAGTRKAVTMIEGQAKNLSEDAMIQAVEFAHANIIKLCEIQEELKNTCGKPLMQYIPKLSDNKLEKVIREKYFTAVENFKEYTEKKAREDAKDAIITAITNDLKEQFPDTIALVPEIVDAMDAEVIRSRILDEGSRPDGRGLNNIRPIDIMVGILPRAHGSALFTRGQTQSLGIVTLGTVAESQRIDSIDLLEESYKRFMLHYYFPPFSTGEVGRVGGVGRREIGHGMLAERAIEYAIPDEKEFPYTIRVVSEVLESNGSSSMATVCAGSLALFNAGVPMKDQVAGIAMGLVLEGERYAILSDIQGIEDHLGDMDFKVAGTATGITAFQMDIKIEGITTEIMRKALEQAKEGRLYILEKMNSVVSQPAQELSPHAPKIAVMKIEIEKIGEVIGPGGRVIKKIIEETGAEINIEQDGTIFISANEQSAIDKAQQAIKGLIEEVEVGTIYKGVVKRITDFGAFVEVLPGKQGLVHISKLDFNRVEKVKDVLKEGDEVMVKVIGIDDQGRINLSRKDAMKKH